MVMYAGQSAGMIKEILPAGALDYLMMMITNDVEQEMYLVSSCFHVLVRNKMYPLLDILINKMFLFVYRTRKLKGK